MGWESRKEFYTILGPITRISALYPVAYATDISLRSISVLLGTTIISVALRHEDIRRYPWYITRGY